MLDAFGGAADGVPTGGLVMDSQGNLYGATWNGGTAGLGTIYKIDTANNLTVLYNFDNSKGSNPYAPLIIDSSGNLYGTAYTGGAGGYGTVFKLDTSNNLTVLYSFTGNYDGGYPYSGLVMDSSGNLSAPPIWEEDSVLAPFTKSPVRITSVSFTRFSTGRTARIPRPAWRSMPQAISTEPPAREARDTGRSSSSALPPDSLSCTASPVELMARHPTRLPSSMPTEIFMAPRILAVPVLREPLPIRLAEVYAVVHNFAATTGSNPGGTHRRCCGLSLWRNHQRRGFTGRDRLQAPVERRASRSRPSTQLSAAARPTSPGLPEPGATSYQMWLGSTTGANDLGYVGTSGLQGSISNLADRWPGHLRHAWGYDSSGNWSATGYGHVHCRVIRKGSGHQSPKGSNAARNCGQLHLVARRPSDFLPAVAGLHSWSR